ncbi:MAG: hypothetical protein CMJ13_03105 [Pelagibacterales bacterium]|nr:hypothetical protein [Pelagibacterales bacterium]
MVRSILDYFGCFILYIFILFLKILGKNNSISFSSFLFRKIGPFTKLNKRAEKNLSYVWPKISKKKINSICIRMWNNLGKNFGEFIFLHGYDPLKCEHTKVYGLPYIKSLITENKKKGKGIIFFSAHFGNWEIGPYIINKLNLDLMGIYRKSNNTCIDGLIQKYRNKNTTYVPKGDVGAKKAYLWLRKGKSLALLIDQKLNEGITVNFLGKPSYTATAIAELAIRMDLDIVPIKLLRTKNYGHEITFFPKISPSNKKLNHEKKVKYILTEINKQLSSWIKKNPEQWLWIHRRWKKSIYM